MLRRLSRKATCLGGLFLVVLACAFYGLHWRSERAMRCYVRIVVGMSLAEVEAIMGRPADEHAEERTAAGEFERSWTFPESGARLTVVFDANGLSRYKEHGPDDCGVTPLMSRVRK